MVATILNALEQRIYSLKYYGLLKTCRYIKNRLSVRYRRDWLKERFLLKELHGFQMYLDLTDPGLSYTLAVYSTRERDQIYLIRNELREGMVVLDIGSNIGFYPLLEASLVGKQGKIYALEPSPQNFDLLSRNIELNHQSDVIEKYRVGASNKDGIEKFYLYAMSNLHTLNPETYRYPQKYRPIESIDIRVVSVADFVRDKKPIDFLRMDIEGHEVEVLEGMVQAIEQYGLSPSILFEIHIKKYDDIHHSMRAPLVKLFELGYYAKTIISNDDSKPKFREKGYKPSLIVKTDGVYRGLYNGISQKDTIEFICDIGFVRAVLLERA